ncbi:hypothetical protein AB0B85_24390 [Micromonospora sp. NPDC049044]|uniref:hypothetical protein n=1 Tax=Micromonospora sp. NPDC049044 TaxID=3154827 RepID=UPI0033C94C1B
MTAQPNAHGQAHTSSQAPTYPYHYFVSFNYLVPNGMSFANVEMTVDKPITSMDGVTSITTHLRRLGYDNPVVLGFTLLRNDLATKRGERQ